jgi:hypothetical protein
LIFILTLESTQLEEILIGGVVRLSGDSVSWMIFASSEFLLEIDISIFIFLTTS